MRSETIRRSLAAALCVLVTVVTVACEEETVTPLIDAKSLPQMLSYGANRYLLDKYQSAGHDTRPILKMLEAVGRDGADRYPEYITELEARGFSIEPTDENAPRWLSFSKVQE